MAKTFGSVPVKEVPLNPQSVPMPDKADGAKRPVQGGNNG